MDYATAAMGAALLASILKEAAWLLLALPRALLASCWTSLWGCAAADARTDAQCIFYEGTVYHCRERPVKNSFRCGPPPPGSVIQAAGGTGARFGAVQTTCKAVQLAHSFGSVFQAAWRLPLWRAAVQMQNSTSGTSVTALIVYKGRAGDPGMHRTVRLLCRR